ncbi:hypothetical protein J40TS1_33690 [Paenibacillus montaniterrae]|uniref:Putative host cell surface-exposed lipoprotein Ltp-like HTH region domain-containing protein n=1 Tax=Paenibacillus montaniterrae TaxID=429341 RepID=A0A919YR29_9BACL|nr:Ltp family lipoprotein [Paenibacillus montaniterrae]GIP17727.1 hypothetical protein J40TS1_33690 [Paenibacillus montaniterrae]
MKESVKKQFYKKWWVGAVLIIVIGMISGCSVESGETKTVPVNKSTTSTPEVKDSELKQDEPVKEEQDSSVADDNVPKEYISALNSAESYSKTMHMSKTGIFEQLTSEYGENFSEEAAQYAIDNLKADWKENALKSAKSYSDTMHMSKKGIYEQLISEFGEQFTAEEAQYAVDNLEADWNENALKSAKSYQDTMDMAPEAIREQLTSEFGEQFTAEEAQYAIDNLDK